jgi:outer membrane protein assembly factor BamA
MPTTLIRTTLILVLTLLSSVPLIAAQKLKIDKVEFEGLNRLASSELLTSTSLKPGDVFDVAAVDTAAQQLIDSGFFKKVAYRTRANKDLVTITFIVEEAIVDRSRVVFDNFIWFTDTELLVAIQRDLPTFTGTAPSTGDTIEKIIKSLQRFLHENKIEATVTHMASQDKLGSSSQEHVFSVNGIPMPICSIHFPGFSNVAETKLLERAQALRGSEYSSKFVSLFAERNLIPIYRELGQLKATFAPPAAKPEETATCKNGVEVTIPVDEGAIYNFEKAEWMGNKSLTPEELGSVLGVSSGTLANGLKLDKAPELIRKAYGRRGFLTVSLKSTPEFNDEARTVRYKFQINEGPQFRMGSLTTKGFTESEVKQFNQKWELKTGAVFDEGYSEDFSNKHMGEILRNTFLDRRGQGKPAPSIKWGVKPNRETLTVDVNVELTN